MTDFIAMGLALVLTVVSRLLSAAVFTVGSVYTLQYMGII